MVLFKFLFVFLAFFALSFVQSVNGINHVLDGKPFNVSYDHRSILINGEHVFLVSGSIHYPRSSPTMWPQILKLSKEAGIDLIEIYVFWNLHEPRQGEYYFSDNANITYFLDLCAQYNLYVTLRIGPYVCAEWNYGGFPVWLRSIPGMVFRDYNTPFMNEMGSWMKYIVRYLDSYFSSKGGPIILAQVENEYRWLEDAYGQSGREYALWAIQFANDLDIGIPWIMCDQDDISTAIDTCNGFYCSEWIPQHFSTFPNQPALYTENWPGWFTLWGQPLPHRPVEDVTFSVAQWVAAGGSHINYYMWHGGTTFGRWTGGPFIITSYDYDVAIDEFGFPHNPKYAKSAELHALLHKFSSYLLETEPPTPLILGPNQNATVYGGNSSLVFLSNVDADNSYTVHFNGNSYSLAPWSVQILFNSQVVYDTSQTSISSSTTPVPMLSIPKGVYFKESVGIWNTSLELLSVLPLEQIDTTKDTSDYLWNVQKVSIASGGTTLVLENTNDLAHVFIDGNLVGSGTGPTIAVQIPSNYSGPHELQILTITVGLVNYAIHMEAYTRGLGNVSLGSRNITQGYWNTIPGLQGEYLKIYEDQRSSSVNWSNGWPANSILTWYKTTFSLPSDPTNTLGWAIDLQGLTKGLVWVNSFCLGRYWLIEAQGDCSPCNFAGGYNPDTDCRTGCGEPTQRYYHIPSYYLSQNNNDLVIFEEVGGDPSQIQIVLMTSNNTFVY